MGFENGTEKHPLEELIEKAAGEVVQRAELPPAFEAEPERYKKEIFAYIDELMRGMEGLHQAYFARNERWAATNREISDTFFTKLNTTQDDEAMKRSIQKTIELEENLKEGLIDELQSMREAFVQKIIEKGVSEETARKLIEMFVRTSVRKL